MDILSAVSETALITLKARVQEAEKDEPVIRDEVAQECLASIQSLLPIETQNRLLNRSLPSALTRHIALRARKYDTYAKEFIAENRAGLVVSLGCGFDTRYWRVSNKAWNYIEVDLPEVIEAKQKVLGDRLTYRMIGCSVLKEGWLEEVRSLQDENILFLAEGLLMYLPPAEVVGLFNKLSGSFSKSEIVFEVVHKKYTKGFWKKGVESKMKRSLGSEAGASYEFGVREAREVEAYGPAIKVVEEWSYFEDEDIRPKFLRLFRYSKFMTRTQWTIKATIGLRMTTMDTSEGGFSSDLARVVVVGTSGAGKSTFANQLAGILMVPHVELDALHWTSNWTPKTPDEFRQLVDRAVSQERWVVDGNYRIIRDLVWPRATTIVWLNYPFSLVFWRVCRRTIARVAQRKELYGGNQESLRKTFLSRDSILWWMITTYSRRQRQFRALQTDETFSNLAWLEFRRSSQAAQFLKLLKALS